MLKILLIDDEEPIRKILGLYLRSKGYEVVTAADGGEGIGLFQQEKPPVVLTDIKMPGMDGIEVLKRVKEINPETEVVVITGHGHMDLAVQALQLDASDFITKPVDNQALSVALKRAKDRMEIRRRLKEYTDNLEVMVKEATAELQKAHDFQTNLIQNSIDGIIAADEDGTVLVFNQGAEELTGYSASDVVGKMHIDEIYPPDVGKTVHETLHSAAYGGKNRLVNYETLLISKSGEEIPVRISGAALFEDGKATGIVCFFQDLREVKRLQRELIQSERLSAIGQAVAGMAHYTKNILNGLQGGVYMVNTSFKKNKPDLLSKGWAMVENNVGRVSDLVMNMLIYSKEREPDYVACSPNDVAQEVYNLMHHNLEAEAAKLYDLTKKEYRVKLFKDLDPSIDECHMDPTGVHRCLLNLVANAIDACTSESDEDKDFAIIIKTSKEDDGVRFDVVDNGSGMTEEVKKKLFERFFSTKGPKGTGLGLLVTRKIVDEHRGSISFESSPDKGTTFTMHFPCAKERSGDGTPHKAKEDL
ncbi:MAG: response regulator [Thermodesulfobacteriota bacterium]|nr:response regulator [Thermodesulfobacteriota bacterium]